MGFASAAAAALALAVMAATPVPGGAGAGAGAAPGWGMAAIMCAKSMFTAPEPAIRQLAVAKAVGDGGLVRGMSDLSAIGSLCLIAGPVAAGAVLALGGPAAAMAPVTASYAASALALPGGIILRPSRGWRDPRSGRTDEGATAPGRLRPGNVLALLASDRRLSAQILLAAGPMVAIFPYTAMIPVVFPDPPSWPTGAGAATGAACAAVGAVGATLWLRSRDIADPARWAFTSAALASVPVALAAGWICGDGHPAVAATWLVLLRDRRR
ncbi:hypothetical protein ACEE18_01085 [Corynebacterium freneyi]